LSWVCTSQLFFSGVILSVFTFLGLLFVSFFSSFFVVLSICSGSTKVESSFCKLDFNQSGITGSSIVVISSSLSIGTTGSIFLLSSSIIFSVSIFSSFLGSFILSSVVIVGSISNLFSELSVCRLDFNQSGITGSSIVVISLSVSRLLFISVDFSIIFSCVCISELLVLYSIF
jgi:hypothetical protein